MKPLQDFDYTQATQAQMLAQAEALLTAAVTNRHMAFHTPVLITSGQDGWPEGRTVVLRSFDASTRRLRCHVDHRSAKVAAIARDPRIGWVFYDPALKWQIRLWARAALHHIDQVAQAAWQDSQRMSRICYGTEPAPGSVIEHGDGFALPQTDQHIARGENNFVALLTQYHRLEALWLGHKGHRRLRCTWQSCDDGAGSEQAGAHPPVMEWLAP